MRAVIAGGGLAAQRCAETMRRCGHDGPLTMICAEDHPPYDRPPLSKELLAGTRDADSLRYRDDAWYAEHDVELLLGTRATGLGAGRVETTGGDVLYDRMLVATGAAPRTLPALRGRENVFVLRDLADALALAGELRPGRHIAVIGGGFVGLEVASTAAALGARVTVIEAAAQPLSAVLGDHIGSWFAGLHRQAGVEVRTGSVVGRVRGGRRVMALELTGHDPGWIEVDAVLVAIGVQPATDWVRGRFSGVFVAGDAAGHHHWEAAARGGADAARGMLGLPAVAGPPDYFWSDQHGVRFQLVGDLAGADRTTVEGDVEGADYEAVFWSGARPIAALLVGRPAALPDARRRIAGTAPPERTAA